VALLRFFRGFRLPLDAAKLLRREPKVRVAAVVPLLVSAAALAAGGAAVVVWWGNLYAIATSWLPWPEAASWYGWLWIGPLRVILFVVGIAAFGTLVGGVLVVAFLLGGVLAAPFLDRLSRRVEEALTGSAVDAARPGLGGLVADSVRAILEEAKRLALFLGAQAIFVVLGALVPGAQPAAGAASIALAILFLALDSASYALDRRGLRLGDKLRWSRDEFPAVAGYGAAAFLLCSVPVVNALALPLLVTAGTELVAEAERRRRPGGEAT
jgi:uncharacterized protein involved in cysteine biosynthesis